MPTYIIDGVKYKSATPLSELELEELAGSSVPPTQATNDGYKMEAVKEGLAGGIGTISGLAAGASSMLRGNIIPYVNAQKTIDAFTNTRQSVREPLLEMMGSTGAQPKDLQERIVGTGIEVATDPTSYILPSGASMTKLGKLGQQIYKPVENFFAGSGAEIGGEVGESVEKKLGGSGQTGRIVGALGGGMTGAVVAGGTPRAIGVGKDVAVAAAPRIKQLYHGLIGKTPMDEVEKQASRHIENIFVAAAASDPNFVKVLEEATKAQAATGVKLPISGILSDNSVINTYIASLASRNPEFHKLYNAQFEAAKNVLRSKSTKMFGAPSGADEALGKNIKDIDVTKSVNQRVAGIQNRIAQSSKGLDNISPSEFGDRVIKVTDAAEEAAKASTRPLYAEAFNLGKAKGVELPKEAVEDIYGFVVGEKANDVFKTFPSIYGRIASRFKPITKEGANLVDAAGKPLGSQTGEAFSIASLEDLDSLKREINNQLRKTKTDSEIRLLGELKDKVRQHIEGLDPEFVAAYKNADKVYLAKVGLPFNEETINMIGRAKFDENVIPLLTRNKSTLSQFIDATGEPGKQLAEKAFINDLTNFAVKDGVLNPVKAKVWLKSKNDALSMLPDVKERVIAMSDNVQELLNQKSAMGASFVKQAEAKILKLEGKSAQEITSKMYSSRDFTEKFMKQHGQNPDNLKAIRSFLLDDVISSGKPLDVLNDRSKAAVFNRVFGAAYTEKIKQLSVIADRITHDPSIVSPNISTIPRSRIEEMVGSPPEMIVSRAVNPIMSPLYNFTALLNRFFTRKTSLAVDRDMKRILLDPQEAMSILKSVQPRVDKINYEQMSKDIAAFSKRTGMDFAEMLKQDMKAGALRSPKAFDQEEAQQ